MDLVININNFHKTFNFIRINSEVFTLEQSVHSHPRT